MRLTPVLEAHHSERRDVIKVGEEKGGSKVPVCALGQPPRFG